MGFLSRIRGRSEAVEVRSAEVGSPEAGSDPGGFVSLSDPSDRQRRIRRRRLARLRRRFAIAETCAGLWDRAFASATVQADTALHGLGRDVLGFIGRQIVQPGDAVLHLVGDPDRGAVWLPVEEWSIVDGGPDRRTHRYLLHLAGPRPRVVEAGAGETFHLRWESGGYRLGQSRGPWDLASGDFEALAAVSASIAAEADLLAFYLATFRTPGSGPQHDKLVARVRNAQATGGLVWWADDSRAGGRYAEGMKPHSAATDRIGPNIPASMPPLRKELEYSMGAAAGVPGALLDPRSPGTSRREAWRAFLVGSVRPVARRAEEEVERVLGQRVRLRFADAAQSDLAAKARAFRSFADGGLPVAIALRLAGLEGVLSAEEAASLASAPAGAGEGD